LQRIRWGVFLFLILMVLAACNARSKPSQPVSTPTRQATLTLVPSQTATFPYHPTSTQTSSPTPTATPTPSKSPTSTATPTITLTPAPLTAFTTKQLRIGVEPASYISAPCDYLRLRWSLQGSTPGTIVVPIMFHGIRGAGKNLLEGDDTSITEEQFQSFVWYAKQQGYQTITTAQLVDFLTQNARIPALSMMLIVDDRRPGTIENYLLPAAQENNWTVTLGWIIGNTDDTLWAWMERLNGSGRLDIQSHGYNHIYITDQTTEADIRQEIFDPIPILTQHFGKRPIAFIWPGGNFTSQAVTIAHEAGYQVGFTAFSRGPLMFNWIPSGEEERQVADPLMTLPRSWSTDRTLSLDIGVQIGTAAQQAAIQGYPQEAEYFRMYCGGELPALADILPSPTPTVTP
jgi:peptidoglycan/xylan/chitin deacetylase (PgdA/CDA1 family)